MTLISRISSLLLLLIIVSCHSPVVGKAGSIPPSHQLWNELLKANVKTNGQVDYKGFIREKPKLESYLKLLSENAPDRSKWSKNEQLAYWINVYNAHTVKLIVDFYPTKSIRDLGPRIKIPLIKDERDSQINFMKTSALLLRQPMELFEDSSLLLLLA